jgi:hypothetical protein
VLILTTYDLDEYVGSVQAGGLDRFAAMPGLGQDVDPAGLQ